MANGALTVYAGRATGTIYTGRATPSFALSPSNYYTPASPAAWGRSGGMCMPIQQCCCERACIMPGETRTIMLNWATWLDSNPGFNLHQIAAADLYDMGHDPPMPADPMIMKVTSGIAGQDPSPVDNADVGGMITVVPPYGVLALLEAGGGANLGSQYKLTVCVTARDCDGRKIKQCTCVAVTVAECC